MRNLILNSLHQHQGRVIINDASPMNGFFLNDVEWIQHRRVRPFDHGGLSSVTFPFLVPTVQSILPNASTTTTNAEDTAAAASDVSNTSEQNFDKQESIDGCSRIKRVHRPVQSTIISFLPNRFVLRVLV